MPRVQYKEKCMKCKSNWVLTSNRREFLICYECQKDELEQPIEDKEMQELFDIPKRFYVQSNFLRNIKLNYQRYGSLTMKQREAFEKVVADMQAEANEQV